MRAHAARGEATRALTGQCASGRHSRLPGRYKGCVIGPHPSSPARRPRPGRRGAAASGRRPRGAASGPWPHRSNSARPSERSETPFHRKGPGFLALSTTSSASEKVTVGTVGVARAKVAVPDREADHSLHRLKLRSHPGAVNGVPIGPRSALRRPRIYEAQGRSPHHLGWPARLGGVPQLRCDPRPRRSPHGVPARADAGRWISGWATSRFGYIGCRSQDGALSDRARPGDAVTD